jgi:hypothetical protein
MLLRDLPILFNFARFVNYEIMEQLTPSPHRVVPESGEAGGQNRRPSSDYTQQLFLFGIGSIPEQRRTGRCNRSPCKRRSYCTPAQTTTKLPNHLRATWYSCLRSTSFRQLPNRSCRSKAKCLSRLGAYPHAKTTSATEAGNAGNF